MKSISNIYAMVPSTQNKNIFQNSVVCKLVLLANGKLQVQNYILIIRGLQYLRGIPGGNIC